MSGRKGVMACRENIAFFFVDIAPFQHMFITLIDVIAVESPLDSRSFHFNPDAVGTE